MNKTFCIYPKDLTTDFLAPVYNAFMEAENMYGISGDSSEDVFYDTLTMSLGSQDIHSFIFLGHGCSSSLYGNNFSELITADDLMPINDKILIFFACNSSQLMKKIGAKKGIGFGFIPSGKDDILHSSKFHDLDLSPMQSVDWSYLRNMYQKCWVRAIESLKDISNVYDLYKRLDLFLNKAIVETLMNFTMANRVLISNILYYVKKDMVIFNS